jgi:hypothetical protein
LQFAPANAQPKIAKEYVFANADRNTYKRMKIKTKEEHRTHNITYTQAGVSCFVGQESVKFKVQFFVGNSVVKIPACV